MKKFLICVLALCLAFSIVSCQSEESVTETTGTTEIAPEESGTEETTVNKNDQNKNQLDCADFINYRASLANTYKKLTEDKKLNVVYFGGSVTAGHGATVPDSYSWRALIGKWLKTEFPDAQINNINRALGESGTYLGAHRVQMDVISAQPDLLFIEYSINDYYYKSTYEQAASQYETIIREVKTALPDTDIVTVLVTEKNFLMTNVNGKLHTQAQAHEDIAKAYNIPTIHAGRYLAATSKFIWSKYAIDGVHLNDTGYAVYYEVIREFMHTNLLRPIILSLRKNSLWQIWSAIPSLTVIVLIHSPLSPCLSSQERLAVRELRFPQMIVALETVLSVRQRDNSYLIAPTTCLLLSSTEQR